MKYYPSYYKDFKCVADKCSDSCCKAWEIVIDADTFEKYQHLQGEPGKQIRDHIGVDADGDYCFELIGGRCPFLNAEGLCNIHIAFDENMTSRICREHPRFFEEYDGFTEITLSLSCPEAARIILLQDPASNTYDIPVYNGDDDVLKTLIDSRSEILGTKKEFFELAAELIRIACRDEMDINLCYIEPTKFLSFDDLKNYIKILSCKCEILSPGWKRLLEETLENRINAVEVFEFIKNNETEIINIFYYYVYRYYLKAVRDLDVYSRTLFILLSVMASAYIALANDIPFSKAARLYSKEIEHSTKNIDIILEIIGKF